VPALPPEFTMRTLVDERWRISVYRNVPWGELYDLAADPYELHNLWDEPASAGIRHELTERLVQKMMDMAERSPRPTHTA
jgi:arylsulfatase A-like enzyme